MQFSTILGIYDFEKKNKRDIFIDLEITLNHDEKKVISQLDETIDYQKLQNDLTQFLDNKNSDLIETLAFEISDIILNLPKVGSVIVKISKPGALEKVQGISVQIERIKS